MSEYLKAAARCDITVVRKSPLPIDEKDIIEEELRARQWDTIAERAAHKEILQSKLIDPVLEAHRQREQDEKLKKVRLEEKRKEALTRKDLDRQAREMLEKAKFEELEIMRMAAFERRQQEMEADRVKANQKAQQKAYEDAQKRMRSAMPKSIEQQADELPDNTQNLTYLERMRIEKERMGRMSKLYEGSVSIKALYQNTDLPKMRPRTQLEADITLLREHEHERIKQEKQQIEEMEREALESERNRTLQIMEKLRRENKTWLEEKRKQEEIEEENMKQKLIAKRKAAEWRHPIDVIHKQVEASFLAEQEAEAFAEQNMRYGYSHVEKLEDQLQVERETWRDTYQSERENNIMLMSA